MGASTIDGFATASEMLHALRAANVSAVEDRTPMRFAALVARDFGGYTRPAGYDEV